MVALDSFIPQQIEVVNNAVGMAEELVSNYYKMSATQWLRQRYDVKTLADLEQGEIVHGPFAQVIRYKGQLKDRTLGSDAYDFYKICLQDHAILAVLANASEIKLLPFVLYIATHELIHIVRFSRFLQGFDATDDERMVEETQVHSITHEILNPIRVQGVDQVLKYYDKWRAPFEDLLTP